MLNVNKLLTARASRKRAEIKLRLRQGGFLENGYDFCTDCEHITGNAGEHGGRYQCCHCGSSNVRRFAGVQSREGDRLWAFEEIHDNDLQRPGVVNVPLQAGRGSEVQDKIVQAGAERPVHSVKENPIAQLTFPIA